ncbi:MAG: zinc-ribbon domain-containing protein [Clostridiales bacterium]|nr:zinc-ribbon domain-containing protein [Clostridiales bacterium]
MLKCNKCGAENDDGQKFCSECGAELVADEQPAVVPEEAGVEPEAATEEVPVAAAEETPAPKKEPKNKLVGKVVNVKDKTMAFEKKHHLIANVLTAVMALVIALVSLFAPVKYTLYDDVNGRLGTEFFEYTDAMMAAEDGEIDTKPVRVEYIEVNQSIFNAVSAIFSVFGDEETIADEMDTMDEKIAEADKAYLEAYMAIMEKYEKKYSDVKDKATWEKAKKEMLAELKKAYNKAYKGVNWFKYKTLEIKSLILELMETADQISGSLEASGSSDLGDVSGTVSDAAHEAADKGEEMMQAVMSLMSSVVVTLITAIIRIVLAIIAIVYLVKAIIRTVKKEPADNAFFKIIATAMVCMAACIALESMSSGLHVGGGAFGLMLACAIIGLVCGSVNALVNGVHKPLTIIKNAVIGVLVVIGFFILCTDFISFKTTTEILTKEYTFTEYGPLGWAMFKGLQAIFNGFGNAVDGAIGGDAEGAVSGLANDTIAGVGLMLSGMIISILFMIMIWTMGVGVARRLRYNAIGIVTKKNGTTVKDAYGTRALITGIVFAFISIIFTLAGSPAIIKGLGKAVDKASQGTVPGASEIKATGAFAVRAQAYVSAILVLVAMIFSAVFKPEGKAPAAKTEEKPAEEAAA